MECIQGKRSLQIDHAELDRRLSGYKAVHIDIGTGDGRFAMALAKRHPAMFVVGLDACRDPLRQAARRAPDNLVFVAANIAALPEDLAGRADRLSINFPWGSLLKSLVCDDPAVMEGLLGLGRAGTQLELLVNGEALATLGSSVQDGGDRIRRNFSQRGLTVSPPRILDKAALRAVPTTWAQRLAFGRDPRALYCAVAWPQPAAHASQRWLERSCAG